MVATTADEDEVEEQQRVNGAHTNVCVRACVRACMCLSVCIRMRALLKYQKKVVYSIDNSHARGGGGGGATVGDGPAIDKILFSFSWSPFLLLPPLLLNRQRLRVYK